ncbi:MAG: hypothetical protein DYH18_03575 [Xanthomonadales bacterium PRO7]|jgi:hypothetical protein|nr:hypothetical protein [Xanthomonadales bacterium PRO7]HMM58069.1 hypothetical protein [Rudaea sp.]
MPLRALLAALVLGVFASQARTADLVGYGEAFNVLYSIDLTTNTAVQIGSAGTIGGQQIANIEGLTFSPGGVLYGVSDAGATKTLLTIDKTTGIATAIGALNTGSNNQLDLGLAFTCDGKLWMSASTGQFWSVDPATANATLLGNLGVKLTGLAARGSLLFGTGSQGNNNLYSIDPVKPSATQIGSYQSTDYVTTVSPGFDATGQLWAVLDYVPPQPGNTAVAAWSDLAKLSVTTGALSNLGSITPPRPIDTKSLAYNNLYQIGLKGLAIPSGICAATATNSPTPALSWRGILALIVLLALVAGTRLRRWRPSL